MGFGAFNLFGLIEYLVFDLWNLIMNNGNLLVGFTSIALAKSKYFYLAIIVLFSETFLEEIWFRGIIQFKLSHLKI